jgi:hypothetical protein
MLNAQCSMLKKTVLLSGHSSWALGIDDRVAALARAGLGPDAAIREDRRAD